MEYIFVFKNNGWWLKITSPEQLFNYWDKTDSRWSETLDNLSHSKEFTKTGFKHCNAISFAAGIYGSRRKLTLVESVSEFAGEIKGTQLDCLLKYGCLYINRKGGYHFPYKGDEPYTQFVRRKELIFPDYEQKDIRVKQFPCGTHFYAYIGDLEVKDGDILKWNTYEEAYNKALEYASNIDKEKDFERE